MKKSVVLFVLVTLLIPMSTVSAESELLTEADIQNELDKIDKRYAIGEEMSKADSDFIKKYAIKAEQDEVNMFWAQNDKWSLSGKKYNKKKTLGLQQSGTIKVGLGFTSGQFSASLNTKKLKGKVVKTSNKAKITCYGAIGSGGVGKVDEATLSNSCKGGKCSLNDSEGLSGVIAYYTISAKGTVKTKTSKLSVVPKAKKVK